ncbi:metallophosphoesterase family protein [Desulfoscipio gibsoniae]|uniref:Putative phosphohydrolase n=1 Tax=Desulfoscipio gibsoniae DSM 7213 TaxID=767817 RepID=R4KQ32_9FIRM|nr:metallophosphoesterase family protein [Desulfoscipio gibsoniae]AGL01756.1 putative phosphohydrolase [Desulfoscipio gibsoniae DSM 7213]
MFFNRNVKHIAAAIATFAISATIFCSPALAMTNNNVQLKFNSNGKFKIVQFTDIQQDKDIDQRTIQLMEKVLDEEKPDLVMVTGDNLTSDCSTPESVSQAVYNIAQPMEKRAINWAVTFGNHDEEAAEKTGLNEEDMLKIYMSYNHNVNQPGVKNITGTGNMNLLIRDSKNKKAAFNLWLLDSGRYAPEEIAGQDFKSYPNWDWLRFDQVRWYYETSEKLEQQYGYKVPSIMFMHIPLWEYRFMWYASVDGRSADNHSHAVTKHSIIGERNEDECPGPFNSGMFAAMLERGDVKGVFVGHDHVNDYMGNYYGILLGYSASTGFDTYGLDGNEKDRLRGARIFNLDENVNGALVETHMVFAKDYGIQ